MVPCVLETAATVVCASPSVVWVRSLCVTLVEHVGRCSCPLVVLLLRFHRLHRCPLVVAELGR